MTTRVVQWTTGNVGQRSVRAVVAHPDLELVGCYAWSADKVGRDVGELCGIDPVGVAATDDVDALLALRPDCVVYNPMWPDVDELVRILEAGVNVVSTAAFINGRGLGADRDRIVDACERGGSSMFGTGISPGFVELIGHRHRRASATASTRSPSTRRPTPPSTTRPTTELPCRLRPADRRPRAAGRWRPRAPRCSARPSPWSPTPSASSSTRSCARPSTPRPPRTSSWTRGRSPPGCVAGVAASWQGRVGDRTVVELNVRWKKGQTLEPDWTIEEGHVIQVDGRPTVTADARVPPAAGLRGHDVRRLHGARDDHDGDAGDQRHPLRGGRRRPASSPTPTCPCRCPAGSCRADARARAGRSSARRTRRVVSCPVVTPSASSSASTWDDAGHQRAARRPAAAGPRRCRASASAAVHRLDLGGAEPLGVAGDLGPDRLAVVGQRDELDRERGAARVGVEPPQVRAATRRRRSPARSGRGSPRRCAGRPRGRGRPSCGSSSGRAAA